MEIKLFDSEVKVMEILWQKGDTTAKEIARILGEEVQWSKTTTYTVIKKCIDKGAIQKQEPHYLCHALITKEETQAMETAQLVEKFFDGSTDRLIAALLGNRNLREDEIDRLKKMVEEMK